MPLKYDYCIEMRLFGIVFHNVPLQPKLKLKNQSSQSWKRLREKILRTWWRRKKWKKFQFPIEKFQKSITLLKGMKMMRNRLQLQLQMKPKLILGTIKLCTLLLKFIRWDNWLEIWDSWFLTLLCCVFSNCDFKTFKGTFINFGMAIGTKCNPLLLPISLKLPFDFIGQFNDILW